MKFEMSKGVSVGAVAGAPQSVRLAASGAGDVGQAAPAADEPAGDGDDTDGMADGVALAHPATSSSAPRRLAPRRSRGMSESVAPHA
jgi:hypothetical protein